MHVVGDLKQLLVRHQGMGIGERMLQLAKIDRRRFWQVHI
jgi:hypothetical protein